WRVEMSGINPGPISRATTTAIEFPRTALHRPSGNQCIRLDGPLQRDAVSVRVAQRKLAHPIVSDARRIAGDAVGAQVVVSRVEVAAADEQASVEMSFDMRDVGTLRPLTFVVGSVEHQLSKPVLQ